MGGTKQMMWWGGEEKSLILKYNWQARMFVSSYCQSLQYNKTLFLYSLSLILSPSIVCTHHSNEVGPTGQGLRA